VAHLFIHITNSFIQKNIPSFKKKFPLFKKTFLHSKKHSFIQKKFLHSKKNPSYSKKILHSKKIPSFKKSTKNIILSPPPVQINSRLKVSVHTIYFMFNTNSSYSCRCQKLVSYSKKTLKTIFFKKKLAQNMRARIDQWLDHLSYEQKVASSILAVSIFFPPCFLSAKTPFLHFKKKQKENSTKTLFNYIRIIKILI